MSKYAKGTAVPVNKSLAEIQTLLERYGASGFGFVSISDRVSIGFEMQNRRFRFTLSMPQIEEFLYKGVNQHSKVKRSREELLTARAQAVNERWRALVLVVKAKLEAVDSGIETIEQAFMAQLVLPNGQTMSEWAEPQIEQAYLGGIMPPMLGAGN
jgi:hypothetical protein